MHKFVCSFFMLIFFYSVLAQNSGNLTGAASSKLQRPKLVIGIVVDQMRWDYLYRYYDRYPEDGGFKQLLNKGFSCENTFIPYMPTVTACGHASIFTGSVPAIDGITGNEWWDYNLGELVYCTEDTTKKTVGSPTNAGKMSPHNLLVTTIGDEIHLANNFRSKVIGIALKDRAAILPAGHTANAAYWYDDKTGDWISSSYYLNDLPKWLTDLNTKKLTDHYFAQDWNTLYPINTYVQSTPDDEPYENKPFGAGVKGFPYNLSKFVGVNYGLLPVTPYGNTVTLEVAKAAILGEQLGSNENGADLLTISISTPDYIGHTFGPNSVEAEDDFLKLDKDLGEFIRFLDKQVGKGEYLLFLSADHGVAQVPVFLEQHKIPAGNINDNLITEDLNNSLKGKFNTSKLVIGLFNNQVYLDRNLMKTAHLNFEEVYREAVSQLLNEPGISKAIVLADLNATTLNIQIKNALTNGDYPTRSGDIQLIYDPQWIEGFMGRGTTHGVWNPYDSHIPLIWYGWNVQPGKTNRETYMTDIAPTVCALLHIQMPSGSIGHVIEGVGK